MKVAECEDDCPSRRSLLTGYKKPNAKQEFIRYFKDSGAAATLQRAMILLYRMPVKPANLAEYYSQYFENGAQALMRISLLKAELCYKKEQLRLRLERLNETQERIEEVREKLGISEKDYLEHYASNHVKEKNRLSIMERYLKDLEKGAIRRTIDDTLGNTNADRLSNKSELLLSLDSNEYLHVGQPPKAEMDPWGLMCKLPQDIPFHISSDGKEKHSFAEAHTKIASIDSNAVMEKEMADEMNAIFESMSMSEGDIEVSEMSSDRSVQDVTLSRSNYESFIRNSESGNRMEKLRKQICVEEERQPVDEHNEQNDAFLFEDDDELEKVYNMLATQQSFEYEFQHHSRLIPRERKEVCEPVSCRSSDKAFFCPRHKLETCSCGEGHVQHSSPRASAASPTRSLGFVPGRMSNWTHEFRRFPCSTAGEEGESYGIILPLTAEDREAIYEAFDRLQEIPMVRVDSSCHCFLTGAYSTDELLGEYDGGDEFSQSGALDFFGEGKLRTSGRSGSEGGQEVEVIDLDPTLETELDEVFKQRKRSSASSKGKKASLSTPAGQGDQEFQEVGNNSTEEVTYPIDVFGIDLAKDVKRDILGFTISELDNSKTTTSSASAKDEAKAIIEKKRQSLRKAPATPSAVGRKRQI